jgi:phenylpropionate dioxygenase-like ring-hydroxylating dioxygenase large terminal subunit
MLLKDHWYVACPSSRLTTDAPRAVQIGDLDIVLFRDADGSARALLDRCCHRGVRLSLGRIREGRVACRYHGWEYKCDGHLAHVPSLTEGDKMPACKVPTFPVIEKDFYVWVWVAGASTTPTYEVALIGLGQRNWTQQTGIWNVNIMDAVENQLDVAHTPFAHSGIYPGHRSAAGSIPPLNQFSVECRVVDGGVELHVPPAPEGSSETRTWHQLKTWLRYELPYRNYVFLLRQKTFAIYNWVPLADGTCRVEFMVTFDANCEKGEPGPSATFEETELEILKQDRVLLESARPWVDRGRHEYEKSVISDYPQLVARRLTDAAVKGREKEFHLDRPRVFSVRG